MILRALLLLSSCKTNETPSNDRDDPVVVPPVVGDLVTNVTAKAPPGGFLSAVLVVPETDTGAQTNTGTGTALSRELEASIGDEPLELLWGEGLAATNRLWKLPETISGEQEIVFRRAGSEQRAMLSVGERWFEEVAGPIGLGKEHQISEWDTSCAESLMGFGFADLDNDGDLDIVRGHITGDSRLLLNEGDTDSDGLPNFVDKTLLLQFIGHDLVASVQFADHDNDGDTDIFLGRRGPNRLLENRLVPEGILRFEDATAGSGLSTLDQRTTNMGFGDYDNDGWLDVYEVNHTWCFPGQDTYTNNADHLYHNRGDGTFEDVSIDLPNNNGQVTGRFGFASLFIDVDRDADQDLWVVNDWIEQGGRNVFFLNEGQDNGFRFTDASESSGLAPLRDNLGKGPNGMGAATGDLNRDGLPDFAFSNIGPNFLLQSVQGGPWVDVAADLGSQRIHHEWGEQSLTWGTHILDLDLDLDLDLFYVGGPIKGRELQPHALFENVGGSMIDRTWEAGILSTRHSGASAQVDLDGDGYLDLVVATWGGPLQVWHNLLGQRNDHHWLVVDLSGDGVSVNRDAFGAIVALTHEDGTVDTCFRTPMPSMSSSGDTGCHFGLGEQSLPEKIEVFWPNGASQVIAAPGIDRRIRVTYAP